MNALEAGGRSSSAVVNARRAPAAEAAAATVEGTAAVLFGDFKQLGSSWSS